MKTLTSGLTASLAGGATTLCWCWRLTRADGIVIGFTDHDRDLSFDGTVFEAAAGFTAGEIREAVGLAVDDLEVEAAVSSERLSEADLAAGLYDDAAVEVFRVDWQRPQDRVLVRAGSLGEIRRQGHAFAAEVRGLSHYLQQPKGRLYQYSCDATLGDRRCGIDLDQPEHRRTALIAADLGPRLLRVTNLADRPAGWASRGSLRFASGANTGRTFDIKEHRKEAAGDVIELWQEPAALVAVGDGVAVTAGCDKRIATCRDRFDNAVAFRGFPFMPGNAYVTRIGKGVVS